MNPLQLRETTMSQDTRRLIRLNVDDGEKNETVMNMLLAKKQIAARKAWLENKGNLAVV